VGYPGRDQATAEQHGLQLRHSHEVPRLKLVGLGTVAMMDDRPYACTDCSMTFGREMTLCGQWAHEVAQARPPLLQVRGGCTHTEEEKEEAKVKDEDHEATRGDMGKCHASQWVP
jgi:hypothetical protein